MCYHRRANGWIGQAVVYAYYFSSTVCLWICLAEMRILETYGCLRYANKLQTLGTDDSSAVSKWPVVGSTADSKQGCLWGPFPSWCLKSSMITSLCSAYLVCNDSAVIYAFWKSTAHSQMARLCTFLGSHERNSAAKRLRTPRWTRYL